MRNSMRALLLALIASSPTVHAAPKVPALLVRAQYVALGYDVGDSFVAADQISAVAAESSPEERRVLEAIRENLDKWGRFVVTTRPEEAEILLAIRVGRRARLE